MNSLINDYKNIALSDNECLQLVNGKANVILYENLIYCNDIDQLINPYGACFLLYETKKNYGHWCAIIKLNNTTVEFFDPYGVFPDDELKWVPENTKKVLNSDKPYLTSLLYNSQYNIDYNEHKFQKYSKNIKTCGRWCAVRIYLKYLSLEEFTHLFKNNGDNKVTLLTMWINE